MVFLLAALVLFTAMHFLPLSRFGDDLGWEMWKGVGFLIWNMSRDPRAIGEPRDIVVLFSFLTFSLLIVASPFLGNVWVKSILAWSMVVIFSGLAAAGFWVVVFKGAPVGDLRLGVWCLMISPVLNFVGLLLARPQWLKKLGLLFPPESQAVD